MEISKLGSYDDIILNMLGSPFRIVLGAGGYGTVITTEEYPQFALKISNAVDKCYLWNKEYNLQKSIYKTYEQIPSHDTVHVVKPLQFSYIEKDRCYILMQRICPPEGDVTIHALLGEIDSDSIDKKRGRFVGQEFLKKYIDMEKTATDLGIFIATVHFKMGLDGSDLEYILGGRCTVDKYHGINVIDFGLVEEYTREEAITSIESIFYFPLSSTCDYYDCTPEQAEYNLFLSELFANAYISEAEKYGKGEEAAMVIEALNE